MGFLTRTPPVVKALEQHAKAVALVARWQTEASTKAAELADLETRIGDEVLDDETAAERIAGDIVRLRAQIDVAARTAEAATTRVPDAGRAVLRAHADALRAEADKIRAQVEQRQTKTDKLLAELSEWEGGARYIAWEPSGDLIVRGTTYKAPITQAMRAQVAVLKGKVRAFEKHAEDTPERVAYQVAQLAGSVETSAPVTVAV